MTLAGTRPPTLDEWNKYELHHRARLAIKPGITGMWQVSGRSEITDFEEVVKLDTEYISEWNVGLSVYLKYAIIDSRSLKSGQSYDKLKRVFVIFICPYDPFGDDRMIYTIRNHCVENPELPYEDGARTIFLYTKGRKGRDNESLSQLLDYMENTTRENAVSEELEAIQEMVDVVKEDAEVTVAYMKGFERDQMFLEEGKELGRRLEQENTLREKNRADTEKNRADTEKNRADTEKNRADAEKHRAEEERQRADAAVEEIEKLRRQLEELQKQ